MVKPNTVAFQVANPLIFILTMLISYLYVYFFDPYDNYQNNTEQQKEWNPKIQPPRWAFGIWGVIFTFIGLFGLYTALGPTIPQGKNDTLCYNSQKGFGIWYSVLVFLLGVFTLIASIDTKAGVFLNWLTILACLILSIIVYRRYQRFRRNEQLNIFEQLLAPGWSLLVGWLLAASTLMTLIFFSSRNINYASFGFPNEDTYYIFILCLAFGVYSGICWVEKEPFVGFVCVWAYGAISSKLFYDRIAKATIGLAVLALVQSSFILGYYYIPSVYKGTPIINMNGEQVSASQKNGLLRASNESDSPILVILPKMD